MRALRTATGLSLLVVAVFTAVDSVHSGNSAWSYDCGACARACTRHPPRRRDRNRRHLLLTCGAGRVARGFGASAAGRLAQWRWEGWVVLAGRRIGGGGGESGSGGETSEEQLRLHWPPFPGVASTVLHNVTERASRAQRGRLFRYSEAGQRPAVAAVALDAAPVASVAGKIVEVDRVSRGGVWGSIGDGYGGRRLKGVEG